MKLTEIIKWVVGGVAFFMAVAYIFNHVSPWASIGVVVIAAYLGARRAKI